MNTLQHKQEISYDSAKDLLEGFKSAYEDQGYDTMLTLTFIDGNTVSKAVADKRISIFLSKLDRLYFGKIKGKQKTKLEREVFRETKDDQGSRWIHYHILIRRIGNRLLFVKNLQALFLKYIPMAQTADVKDRSAAGHYGIKRDFRHGDVGINNWLHDLGHTDQGTEAYSKALNEGESDAALSRIYRLHFEGKTEHQENAYIRHHFIEY